MDAAQMKPCRRYAGAFRKVSRRVRLTACRVKRRNGSMSSLRIDGRDADQLLARRSLLSVSSCTVLLASDDVRRDSKGRGMASGNGVTLAWQKEYLVILRYYWNKRYVWGISGGLDLHVSGKAAGQGDKNVSKRAVSA